MTKQVRTRKANGAKSAVIPPRDGDTIYLVTPADQARREEQNARKNRLVHASEHAVDQVSHLKLIKILRDLCAEPLPLRKAVQKVLEEGLHVTFWSRDGSEKEDHFLSCGTTLERRRGEKPGTICLFSEGGKRLIVLVSSEDKQPVVTIVSRMRYNTSGSVTSHRRKGRGPGALGPVD